MNRHHYFQRILATALVAFVTLGSISALAQDPASSARLLTAAKAADAERVEALLSDGVDPNTTQADGATALHWAAHHDDVAMADALLAATADAGAANEFGATPLWLAAQNGSATMVKRLLEASADPNAALASGETVLMMAARTGSSDAVRLLVEYGATIDATEHSRGQTAMMWAIAERQSDVVKTLLDLGADISVRSAERPRRIHTRTAGFNPSGVVDVTQGGNSPLLFAARHGDLDAARYLIDAGADANDTAPVGTSALVVAAHSGHTELALYLLDQGADPNTDGAGYTALHAATLRGDVVMADALLAAGADANALVTRGSEGRRNSPDYVLEHDVVGATPFWLAAHFSEPTIMRSLIEHGADASFVMMNGTTALHAATAAGRRQEPGLTANPAVNERRVLDTVTIALDHGTDIAAIDEKGNTVLHDAASRRLDTVVELLVERGADLTAQNADGQTPLALATGRGGDDGENPTVELLRRLGANN